MISSGYKFFYIIFVTGSKFFSSNNIMVYKEDKYYLDKVLQGNADSYSFIINKYKSKAFTLALRILKNREDAEEASQDAFIKCYYGLNDFSYKSSFSTWLYRIVYTSSISMLRQKKPAAIELDDTIVDSAGPELREINSALDKLKDEEQKYYVNLALSTLDEEDVSILTLYYQLEKSAEEIGEITGLSRSNVKIKLFRIRKKLQQNLEKILKEEVYSLL